MAYWRLLYHLVWATHEREPLLTPEREALLYRILGGKAAEIGVFLHAMGNAPDHVHLVVGIPPKLAVSECLRQLKGASSHALNHHDGPFRWQEGYGAVSLCDEILPKVIAYVRNQKRHHREGSVDVRFERDTDEPTILSP
jgi:putative transposase